MSGTEIIRPSSPADIPQLQRLFTEVFGSVRDEAVWTWKYFDHPRGPHSFVVEAAGRLVAHCGGTEVTMVDGGAAYPALQSVDFMSSRNYSGGLGRGGVFARMVDAFFAAYCGPQRIPLVYGFPGERHRVLGERILGYRPVERVGEVSLDPVSDTVGDPEPLDASLVESFRAPAMAMGAERSADYLRWRYLLHPTFRYHQVTVRRWPWRSRTEAIVRITEEGRLLLMELGGRVDERGVERLSQRLRQMGRNVHGWTPGRHPVGQMLLRAGWQFAERDHRVEVRSFTRRVVPQPGGMYYSLGDYDVD